MYVPDEKMKVNKFRIVAIPRNVEYMRRFGKAETPSNQYTGDQRAQMAMNKVEVLGNADYLNELQMREENNPQNEE